MKHKTIKLLLVLCLGAGSLQANAYNTWTCLGEKVKWSSNSVTMRYSNTSFAPGSWRSSLDAAINHLNENPTPFNYSKSYGDTSVALDNGQSEAWFSNSQSVLNGAPAIAYTQIDCIDYWIFGKDVEITEADVIFDAGESYTTSMSSSSLLGYGGSRRPFQTTAIHELGHGVGLGHVNNTYNIMGTDWTHIHANGGTARSYLGEDAANGMVYLYGTTGSNAEDLGLSHWRYLGTSGEYSTHQKTRVTNSSGGSLSTVTIGGETGYRVSKGQTVRVYLTYENNGKSQQSNADVRHYVSTNNYVSTYDTLLNTRTVNLGRNTVWTTYTTVTIPGNLTSGRNYWLGAVIDADRSLPEMTESNNATYLPVRIN